MDRGDTLLGAKEVVMEKGAVTSQIVAATVTSSTIASTATALVSQHTAGPDGTILSTDAPDEDKDISDAFPTPPDLDSVDSSLFTTILTSQMSQMPPPESTIHDEL